MAVKVASVAMALAFEAPLAHAQDAAPAWAPTLERAAPARDLEFSASIGVLNGQAQEYVYDTDNGRTVSRLDWDYGNVTMFTAGAQWQASDWFRFALKGSTNLATSSKMSDYDWNIGGCPSDGNGGDFCESFHPGTRLVSAYRLDASVRLHEMSLAGFALAPVAGFKWDYYSWRAYNGVSNYAGVFKDGLGISYEQWWHTPYIGFEISRSFANLDVTARATFSDWAQGHDRDHHHSRSLVFTETFDGVRSYGLEVGARYALTQRVGLTLDYGYTTWQLTRGPALIGDLGAGTSEYNPGDAAGASSHTHLVSLGVNVDLTSRPLTPSQAADAGSADGADADTPAWGGLYAGAAVSAIWHDVTWHTEEFGFAREAVENLDNFSPNGALFAGWNFQRGATVWGAETEVGRSSGDSYLIGIPGTALPGSLVSAPDSVAVEQGWNASLRLRAGVLLSPALLAYATGGLAYEQVFSFVSCSKSGPWCTADGSAKETDHLFGWTVGAGLEALLANDVFVRAEYRYADYGRVGHEYLTGGDVVSGGVDVSDHRLNLGAGVKF